MVFISNSRFPQRAAIFCISLAIVTIFCSFHGLSERTRTILLIKQMMANGKLTGKLLRVIHVQDDEILLF